MITITNLTDKFIDLQHTTDWANWFQRWHSLHQVVILDVISKKMDLDFKTVCAEYKVNYIEFIKLRKVVELFEKYPKLCQTFIPITMFTIHRSRLEKELKEYPDKGAQWGGNLPVRAPFGNLTMQWAKKRGLQESPPRSPRTSRKLGPTDSPSSQSMSLQSTPLQLTPSQSMSLQSNSLQSPPLQTLSPSPRKFFWCSPFHLSRN